MSEPSRTSEAASVYYKVLAEDGSCHHGGRGAWTLPNGKPGAWRSVKGDLVACRNGIHLCRREDLIHWLGPAIFLAEAADGPVVDAGDKIVVRKARLVERLDTWNETTARLFAADCAEQALQFIPGSHQEPFVAAINAARGFARGEISDKERDAAWDAAWAAARAAARAAAWDAARDAARAWQTERLFDYLEGRAA